MDGDRMKKYVNLIQEILYRDYMQKEEVRSVSMQGWLKEQIIKAAYYEKGYTEEAVANEIFEKFLKNIKPE